MWSFKQKENLHFDNNMKFMWASNYEENLYSLNLDLLMISFSLHD